MLHINGSLGHMSKAYNIRSIELDKDEQKAIDNINQYGCHVLMILEGDGQPQFTYTIGINKMQSKPDLVIVGLKHELAHLFANGYKDRVLAGEVFLPGKFYPGFLEGFDVCFVNVPKWRYKEYFGWGLWLHQGEDFEMLQMVWPTTDGLWPWNKHKNEYYQWVQPILSEDGTILEVTT